jgi:hypothetical protein
VWRWATPPDALRGPFLGSGTREHEAGALFVEVGDLAERANERFVEVGDPAKRANGAIR